jgi:hypothetical protein
MRDTAWFIGALLALPGPAAPSEPSLCAPVRSLIEQLGDTRFEMREAADRALAAAGPAVLPELRKSANHSDAEVRRRLQGLIPALERAAALQPRRVTLHLKQAPLADVVAEISRQTGYVLVLPAHMGLPGQPDAEKSRYTFDFDGRTFWEVMDQVADAGQLTLQPDANDSFQLISAAHHAPYVCHSGTFRLTAQNFDYSRGIDLSQVPRNATEAGPRTESLAFCFNVAAEPKLPLLGLGEVKLVCAYDDQNRSMVPPGESNPGAPEVPFARQGQLAFLWNMAEHGAGTGRTCTMDAQIGLVRPARTSERVKVIRGTVQATLLAEQRPEIQIDAPLGATGKRWSAGNLTLELREAGETENGGRLLYNFKISAALADAKDAQDPASPLHSLPQRFQLEDAAGNKFHLQGGGCYGAGANSRDFQLAFTAPDGRKLGKPTRLVYHSWVTIEHAVPFEFKDLPLP